MARCGHRCGSLDPFSFFRGENGIVPKYKSERAWLRVLYFDDDYYLMVNKARWEAATRILEAISSLGIQTVLDVACGPGWFAKKLVDRGLAVVGLEGRADLIGVASNRVPQARFLEIDLNTPTENEKIPKADLVFCFGCLYHLENPIQFMRRLGQWTHKVVLLETQVISDDKAVFQMVDESQNETQGLNFKSLMPSDGAVVKGLSWAGFRHIYEWQHPVPHNDFVETEARHRRRRIYVATMQPVSHDGLFPREIVEASKPSFDKVSAD